MSTRFLLRHYRSEDEDAAIAVWQRTWQQAYPSIDFAARLQWWRTRWRDELVPHAAIIVAEQEGTLVGFVTIDASGYLDQLVVAPDRITLLVNNDNRRAIRFYERNGFVQTGEDLNPTSGRPVLTMEWTVSSL